MRKIKQAKERNVANGEHQLFPVWKRLWSVSITFTLFLSYLEYIHSERFMAFVFQVTLPLGITQYIWF